MALPPSGYPDGDKKKFLADAVAFVNTSGGTIIYGVKEQRDALNKSTGIPQVAEGIADINSDSEIRRLDSLLRDGVEPRISNIQIKAIDGFSDASVILIELPRSWNSPHIVSFKGNSRFFARNNAGKYQLDVGEIRSAFAASGSLPERIRNFRAERITKIGAGETPAILEGSHFVLLHLIPIEKFASDIHVEIIQVGKKSVPDLKLIDGRLGNKKINMDGLLDYKNSCQNTTVPYYTQLFRNGVIEAVDTDFLQPIPDLRGKEIHIYYLEDYLLKALREHLNLLKQLKVNPPFLIMLTLIGVVDFTLYLERRFFCGFNHKIDREILTIPDVLIEVYGASLAEALQPVFDTLWQSAGMDALFKILSFDSPEKIQSPIHQILIFNRLIT